MHGMRKLPVVPICRRALLLSHPPNQWLPSRIPHSLEGRFAVVTDVGSGMRWTRELRKTNASVTRTEKSCGPGAPMQAPRSLVSMSPTTDGGNQAWSPGRARRTPLKPSRRECRDASAGPVVTAACFFCCRRAMGVASTRHSLRPLLEERAV
jgi:hypothetical protein